MNPEGGRRGRTLLPPHRADTEGVTCSDTAQDSCLIKDPRSAAMGWVIAIGFLSLGVIGRLSQGGGRSAPTPPTPYSLEIVCGRLDAS
jgi:hypothetical protein